MDGGVSVGPHHKFLQISMLKTNSKGGCIEGQICAPDNVTKIEIFTCSKDFKDHPTFLLVSPKPRPQGSKISPKVHEFKVILVKNEDKFQVHVPSYWSNFNVRPNKFLPQKSQIGSKITLGSEDLRLNVVKLMQKGDFTMEEMKKVRVISETADKDKLRLGVRFYFSDGSSTLSYSNLIYNEDSYVWKIWKDAMPSQTICDKGFQNLNLVLKDKITDKVRLQATLHGNIGNGNKLLIQTTMKTFGNYCNFQMNLSGLQLQIPFATALITIKRMDDQDYLDDTQNMYDLEDSIEIKIMKHLPQNCLCHFLGTNETQELVVMQTDGSGNNNFASHLSRKSKQNGLFHNFDAKFLCFVIFSIFPLFVAIFFENK